MTLNYQRNHRLNLWFTITAPSQRKRKTLTRLENDLGVIIHTMPAEKVYKIRLSLPMGRMIMLTDTDIQIIQYLQDIP